MEIKVQCDCGQKFKFDVEPVNGQMPFVVNCPVCRADGTAKANVMLQQLLPPPPVHAPPPPAVTAPAPMRINRPAAAAVAAPPPAEAADASEADEGDDSEAGGVREFKLGWKVWGFIILFIGIGLIGSFDKWSRRISFVKDIVQFVRSFSSSDSKSSEAGAAASVDWTLPDDNGVMMLVKATNETAVAEACAEHLTQQLKTKVSSVKVTSREPELDEASLYVVDPAYNGCVALSGALTWDDKEVRRVDSLVEFLSKKLNTTAVGVLMDDDAEFGIFFVYENGQRRFRLDRSFKIQDGDLQEVVKLDGETWATGLGFKPGEEGFKGFTMEDANALTEHLGLKLAGRPDPASCIVLRSGAKP
jgi:hypothetical protein